MIQVLPEGDVDTAGAVLGRAFRDDPLYNFLFARVADRPAAIAWLMHRLVCCGQRYGLAHTTAPEVQGLAVWLGPEHPHLSTWQMVRAGLLKFPFRFGLSTLRRLFQILDYLEEIRLRSVDPAHWYLLALGVDTPLQGRGIGGKLLGPVLQQADQRKTSCYLETQTVANVAFYRRHGFEVVTECEIPDGGPHCWCMKRAAR